MLKCEITAFWRLKDSLLFSLYFNFIGATLASEANCKNLVWNLWNN